MGTSSGKPYRVYRQPRRVRGDGSIPWGDGRADAPGRGGAGAGGASSPGRPRVRSAIRILRRTLLVVVLLALAWGAVAYLSFRSAVAERNDLVDAETMAALSPADGPVLFAPHVTLLVGADTSEHRRSAGEAGATGLADTMILLRTDPRSRSFSMLSIPRDLYVDVPGVGRSKINAAYGAGGLPLAIRTVRELTGVEVNHVVQVDFDGFKQLIDDLGGVVIDNPTLIQPTDTFDGLSVEELTFKQGELLLDGRRARAYARIRKTRNPEENDLTRAARQQAVINAIVGEIVSIDSVLQPRETPRAVVRPLLTDITAAQMLGMGFSKAWATGDNSLRCRLGGEGEQLDGQAVLVPGEDNRATVRMWQGEQAPLAPDTDTNPFAPGCNTG